jgi:putative SOS response-associated peptidase YedK
MVGAAWGLRPSPSSDRPFTVVAPYYDRQMAVLRRAQRLDWLDGRVAEGLLLPPLTARSFRVREDQRAFAF